MEGLDIIQGMKRNWGPEQFHQRGMARNENGYNTDWQRWNQDGPGRAVAMCTAGSIYVEAAKLGYGPTDARTNAAFRLISEEIEQAIGGKMAVSTYNDSHSYGEVMNLIDNILLRHLPTTPTESRVEERELVTA